MRQRSARSGFLSEYRFAIAATERDDRKPQIEALPGRLESSREQHRCFPGEKLFRPAQHHRSTVRVQCGTQSPTPKRDADHSGWQKLPKSRVGNSSHLLANPLREDKSRGPSTEPARCRNGCSSLRRASSSCSRMIRPRGTPALREAASSHPAKSSGRRTVIVLLIRLDRNTAISPQPVAHLSLATG